MMEQGASALYDPLDFRPPVVRADVSFQGKVRHAEADRYGDFLARHDKGLLGNHPAQAFGNQRGPARIRIVEHDEELLATIAAADVLHSQPLHKTLDGAEQDLVPDFIP